jgi:hypothetical protein
MNLSTTSPAKFAVAITLAVGICSTTLSASPAQALPSGAPDAVAALDTLGVEASDLAGGLELIDRIPESVLLEGQAAFDSWAADQSLRPPLATRASILACTGAIAMLIASTAFPVAKILKIKRLINSLGGVAKAVRIMWGASFSWEKIRALGGAAAALGAELIGVAAVKRGCFR